jgi:uncharacterized protein YukE
MSWSPPAPASFAPLDGRNGVAGDAGELTTLARRYANTAAEIEAQAANLSRLTSQARSGWKGKAGETFVDKAGGLAERILKAKGRYEAAARALQQFADDLGDVQTRAYGAVRRAQDAEADQRALQANRPPRAPATATPEEASAAAAEVRLHQDAVDDASARLATARNDYDRAKADYDSDARSAARILRNASGREDLKDSWWDRNAGWLKTAIKIIGFVVLVLAVIALVISIFIPGLNVAVGALALSQVLNLVGAGLTALTLAFNIGLLATDNGDWSAVIEDVVSLATFGLGQFAGAIVGKLAGAASRIGMSVAASRAGRAAFTSRHLPGRLFDLGQRVPATRTLLSAVPRMGRVFDAADVDAAAARATIQSLDGANAPFLSRLLAWGDVDLSKGVTLVSRIDNAVTDVHRLGALDWMTRSVTIGGGIVLGAPTLVVESVDTYGEMVSEPRQEAQEAAQRAETVQQWSMPLLQVR